MALRSARHILLCLRYGIGDVIMETPIIETLRAACPEARIDALGARPAIELLEDDPRIDRLFCVQDWGLRHWGDAGNKEIGERLRRWLDAQSLDLILDPSHAVIAVRDAVRNHPVPVLDACGAAEEQTLSAGTGGVTAIQNAVRREWGMEIPEGAAPRLQIREGDDAFADSFLTGVPDTRLLVGLSAEASSPLKRWPVVRLAAAADLLVEQYDSEILFYTGPAKGAVDSFLSAARHPERIKIVANLHLKQVSALLNRSDLLICNDTGLMHMGAALGLPVVAVFGPTSPHIYFPGGVGSMALGGDLPCPHRKIRSFGPPQCLVRGHCLQGYRSCIDAVSAEEMTSAIRSCGAMVEGSIQKPPNGAPASKRRRQSE